MKPNNRNTLNKKIAAAKTTAGKWEIALHGGEPPTEIQFLPTQATGLRKSLNDPNQPAKHGPGFYTKACEQLKQRFTRLLFPALLEDNPAPFAELLEAMAKSRRSECRDLNEFISKMEEYSKQPVNKKESGRRLRLALLSLWPDQLLSMGSVIKSLNEQGLSNFDESHVRRTMREIDVHLLRPGEYFIYRINGRAVRTLRVSKSGKPIVTGKSWEDLRAEPAFTCWNQRPKADK
jgi:hypothetical protein